MIYRNIIEYSAVTRISYLEIDFDYDKGHIEALYLTPQVMHRHTSASELATAGSSYFQLSSQLIELLHRTSLVMINEMTTIELSSLAF